MTAEIENRDVQAAVAAGYLSEAQAADLLTLAAARRTGRAHGIADDEPFQLFRGFNEVFLSVGIAMMTAGVLTLSALLTNEVLPGLVLVALLAWSGAEYFTRRRRMILPSIALSIILTSAVLVFVFFGFATESGAAVRDDGDLIRWGLVFSLMAGLAAASAFYWRFRLPFSLFLVGALVFAASLVAAGILNPERNLIELANDPFAAFDIKAGNSFGWIILLLGIAGFVVAMRFDLSDPHRVTRRSACGFWLHLLAGPALVNTLALTLFKQDTGFAFAGLFLLIALVVVVSIVIDRRSFMISAVSYLILLSFRVFSTAETELSVAVIILCLGLITVALGAFWISARGWLLRALPDSPYKQSLPPYRNA